jgi:hypothetical protein
MKKIILYFFVFLVIALVVYFLFFKKISKAKAIEIITASGMHSKPEVLTTLKDGLLSEWAKAVKKGKQTFVFEGKTHYTKGGAQVFPVLMEGK